MSTRQSAFHLTPHTRSAFRHMNRQLQAVQQGHPLSLAWLIMPGTLTRFWRAQAGSSLNVHILTLGQLAATLRSATGAPPPVLHQPQRVLRLSHLMEQAHAEQRLQILPAPAQAPNLARHIDALIQELKQAEISVAAFRANAVRTGQTRDGELAYLYHRYEATLAAENLCDASGLMTQVCRQAAEIWAVLNPPAYVGVVGHDTFSRLEQRLLASVRQHAGLCEIFYPAGSAPFARELAVETAHALGLTCPAQVLAAPSRDKDPAPVYVEAPTPEHEVRHVLRQIKQRHADAAISLPDFTICLPNFTTYAPLLQSCADEYGLPLTLGRSLAWHPLAQTLQQLLYLFPDFPWHPSWDVLESPWIRQSFLNAADLRDLRRITQRGQVIEGLSQWRRAIGWGTSRAGPDGLPPERVAVLGAKLEAFFAACCPPQGEDPQDSLSWVARFLPEDGEGSLILTVPDCNDLKLRTLGQAAWVRIRQTLQSLQADRGQPPSAWADIRERLRMALQEQELQIYEPARAVQVTSFAQGWAQPASHLYVLGLNEGVLPRMPDADPLYSQPERRDSPLPLPLYDPRRAHLRWTQLLANSDTHVTVSRPTADGEVRQIAASVFWTPETAPLTLSRSLIPPVAAAASLTELVTALQDQPATISSDGLQQRLYKARDMAAIVAARLSAKGPVGPFEGHLTQRAIRGALQHKFDRETLWSASALQDYARCPLGFLARHVLGLQPDAQAAAELDFATRGRILHDILHRLLCRVRDRGMAMTEAHAAAIRAQVRTCVQEVWAELPDRYLLQPYPLQGFDRRQMEQRVLQAVQQDMADTEWQPFQLEWHFGDHTPAEVRLRHADREYILPLQGIVDRIDRSVAGHLRVVDYKSRSAAYSRQDMHAGLNTQVVLYARVVAQQGWGPVTISGFRMLHCTTAGKLGNRIDWTAASPQFVPEVEAALCRHQDDMRWGRFPAAPPHFAGANDRCAHWCALAEFCQPSPASRRKAARAFVP